MTADSSRDIPSAPRMTESDADNLVTVFELAARRLERVIDSSDEGIFQSALRRAQLARASLRAALLSESSDVR